MTAVGDVRFLAPPPHLKLTDDLVLLLSTWCQEWLEQPPIRQVGPDDVWVMALDGTDFVCMMSSTQSPSIQLKPRRSCRLFGDRGVFRDCILWSEQRGSAHQTSQPEHTTLHIFSVHDVAVSSLCTAMGREGGLRFLLSQIVAAMSAAIAPDCVASDQQIHLRIRDSLSCKQRDESRAVQQTDKALASQSSAAVADQYQSFAAYFTELRDHSTAIVSQLQLSDSKKALAPSADLPVFNYQGFGSSAIGGGGSLEPLSVIPSQKIVTACERLEQVSRSLKATYLSITTAVRALASAILSLISMPPGGHAEVSKFSPNTFTTISSALSHPNVRHRLLTLLTKLETQVNEAEKARLGRQDIKDGPEIFEGQVFKNIKVIVAFYKTVLDIIDSAEWAVALVEKKQSAANIHSELAAAIVEGGEREMREEGIDRFLSRFPSVACQAFFTAQEVTLAYMSQVNVFIKQMDVPNKKKAVKVTAIKNKLDSVWQTYHSRIKSISGTRAMVIDQGNTKRVYLFRLTLAQEWGLTFDKTGTFLLSMPHKTLPSKDREATSFLLSVSINRPQEILAVNQLDVSMVESGTTPHQMIVQASTAGSDQDKRILCLTVRSAAGLTVNKSFDDEPAEKPAAANSSTHQKVVTSVVSTGELPVEPKVLADVPRAPALSDRTVNGVRVEVKTADHLILCRSDANQPFGLTVTAFAQKEASEGGLFLTKINNHDYTPLKDVVLGNDGRGGAVKPFVGRRVASVNGMAVASSAHLQQIAKNQLRLTVRLLRR